MIKDDWTAIGYIVGILFVVALWGGIGYVVIHFIVKWW